MSNEESHIEHTQHAFLVVWGWFAEQMGFIEQLERVPLKQKRSTTNLKPKSWNFWWLFWLD